MIKDYCVYYFLFILSSCNYSHPKEYKDEITTSNVVNLADAVMKMRSVKLSEISDTIIFLPLETTNNNLISNEYRINFSSKYIFINGNLFDWFGQSVFKIGRIGNGPGEDLYYPTKVINNGNRFVSLGDKLILYDSKGKFAGKEYLMIDKYPQDLANTNVNSSIVVYSQDSIFFMNYDFEIINKQRVVPVWTEKSTNNISSSERLFTEYNDSTLFYNYINDTIYRVLGDNISPRWIIDLKKEKVPLKHLLGSISNRLQEGSSYFMADNLDDWDYIKETDNRIRSFAIYETENLLIIKWLKLREYSQLRNYSSPVLQVAYFNKKNSETIAVNKEGFIDDISSLGTFYPTWGTYKNYMISSYWPYELREITKGLVQTGKLIDNNLQSLLLKVKDDDNPVLVLIHLKI